MIPNLDPRVADNILQYLSYELQRCKGDRTGLEEDWIRYSTAYRAKPKEKIKEFPWKNAANLTIPVMATDVDTTVAALLGVIFGSPNIWSCEGLRPDWLDYAARMEEFLEYAQETELGMYAVVVDWVTEIAKLGTGILKQRYRREQKKMWEWREVGPNQTIQQMVRRLAVDRPDVSHVLLSNFYIPGSAMDVEQAAWVGERLELNWTQLDARVRAGIYREDLMTKIGADWRRRQQPQSPYADYQRAQEELDNFVPGLRDNFELFEFWLDADVGDVIDPTSGQPLSQAGELSSLVCTVHIPTMTYARIDFNPFFHQEKPYSAARFLKVEGRFYGIGLGEMQHQFQEEISTMHNQRIDGNTIRNVPAFKGRRGSVRQDEPIWPGRTILMDSPADDLLPMVMGQGATDTVQEETLTLQYARERPGISDYQRGGAGNPAISYSTATTTIEMLKQGRLRLDQVLREIQGALTETGQRVVELYQQFDQGGKPYLVMGDKDGQVVEQVLHFPLDTIRLGIAVKTTATNAQVNKETRIRTDQIVLGLVMQFYQQLFGAMQIVVNPQLPPPLRILAIQMIQGGTAIARRILDAYGTQDIDKIIPDMEQLSALTQQLGGISPQPAFGQGGAGLGPGPSQPLGLPAGPTNAQGAAGPVYSQTAA